MVEASNDFDSTDHQGGMFWPHVIPGNGLVANTHGLDIIPNSAALQNALTTTYRARSGFTSWGTHNMFSAATRAATTSESTPTVGGVMALVLSYGKTGGPGRTRSTRPLSNDEAVQVMRATASDIDANPNPPTGWPGKPGWDLQYGYGRPNVYKAMQAVARRQHPAGGLDRLAPTGTRSTTRRTTSTVPVTGHVDGAPRRAATLDSCSSRPAPSRPNGEFITAGTGDGSAPVRRQARNDRPVAGCPQSFWYAAFACLRDQGAVDQRAVHGHIRLRVTDAKGRVGEERRTIAVHHDPTLRPGFPARSAPAARASRRSPTCRARGHQAIVFGDADGRVHALDGPRQGAAGLARLHRPRPW